MARQTSTARHSATPYDIVPVLGFRAFGGGFFERVGTVPFVWLLAAFFAMSVAEAGAGWLLWNGARSGAVLGLALLPVSAIFWWGFALPIPPIDAFVRTVLIIVTPSPWPRSTKSTLYLVEVEDEDELSRWLARHHQELFEEELKGWYTDPALWPRDRSLKMLEEWCSFELHTVVVDTGESPLKDDEFEE